MTKAEQLEKAIAEMDSLIMRLHADKDVPLFVARQVRESLCRIAAIRSEPTTPDWYEEIKRRLLNQMETTGRITKSDLGYFIAEVDAPAPACVCGETGARNCGVHNEPAPALDEVCQPSWEIAAKVDEATICENCLNPKAHHYDGFCYQGSRASEQRKFTPRQPAPKKVAQGHEEITTLIAITHDQEARLQKLEQAAGPLGEVLNNIVTLFKYHLTEHQRVSVQQDNKFRDLQESIAVFEKWRQGK